MDCRIVHILNENVVCKIPYTCIRSNRSIPQFANQNALEVVLMYETLNHKPAKLIEMHFNRIKLNSEARIAERIPIIPTLKEKQAFYRFVERKYPLLWEDCVRKYGLG
jgi:hypothetical protein